MPVLNGLPAMLAWLGSVRDHRTRSLGVEHFGQITADESGMDRVAEFTSDPALGVAIECNF